MPDTGAMRMRLLDSPGKPGHIWTCRPAARARSTASALALASHALADHDDAGGAHVPGQRLQPGHLGAPGHAPQGSFGLRSPRTATIR